mmetsp:Transcript_1540/g.6718  ORF Transcript_1540/g.6718 Transcript_1540/m.6718 type:complete len:217 (+) Transcript_1540:704-1354(+)
MLGFRRKNGGANSRPGRLLVRGRAEDACDHWTNRGKPSWRGLRLVLPGADPGSLEFPGRHNHEEALRGGARPVWLQFGRVLHVEALADAVRKARRGCRRQAIWDGFRLADPEVCDPLRADSRGRRSLCGGANHGAHPGKEAPGEGEEGSRREGDACSGALRRRRRRRRRRWRGRGCGKQVHDHEFRRTWLRRIPLAKAPLHAAETSTEAATRTSRE